MLDKLKLFLQGRQKAYQQTFNNPVGKQVLEDLSTFCRATKSTFHKDARASALLEGRKEVWLRIQEHLEIDSEELFKLYNGRN